MLQKPEIFAQYFAVEVLQNLYDDYLAYCFLCIETGDVTCLATVPVDMKAEAHFIAKEDGVIAGISFAEMIFNEVDPSLKVEWSQKDGNYVHKGMQFGKVYGKNLDYNMTWSFDYTHENAFHVSTNIPWSFFQPQSE
ncbi:nicotinate-nucleotide pyrophosphorylase [carboxylating], chloroplastic-like isoform X2 [Phoenix dactylifera]|uniref:Nicotinate-nucleotide pyrophosphorylase [carboxylating], chloroplastic-like isoform X2 n=1 Tax=Phoenix dactylifera TaxID=42345 RepID=A0A8B8ZQZ9_PHODC|nr:nicotinate-nucleotide pyrophosphorylase [carboxylating], chloroplastic-like isoform X2 [Phoenix dactylifera]